MDTFFKTFPLITEIQVAWGDMDALKHVNNVMYFRYFEIARLEYFRAITLVFDLQTCHVGPIIKDTQCTYKMPVTFPDTLCVGARTTDIKTDRFTMEYQIFSKKLGKIVTKGSATIVIFDFEKNCKATMPTEIKNAILKLENSVQEIQYLEK
ncbi:acyl-CoA thioesterase [Vibrio sagamiensis]|uniref:Thioesterase n=1 Tax=Vibrio sagamiensis NBRC 104589 TaxID=1219064 RepID=A0A511QDD5_9VIBR|nr:acyl-CoA thioesterase [Vibrio sagamiensis]PNQ65050.1 acyl-CoA thioesterase [Vibrio agarivorans]GEM75313.1 thioesterase [Vibrio sagamiensis NBRC 104589]